MTVSYDVEEKYIKVSLGSESFYAKNLDELHKIISILIELEIVYGRKAFDKLNKLEE